MPGGSGFIDINVTFEGQAPLIHRFATWAAFLHDLSPAWEQVGEKLLDDFSKQFGAEGGYLGAIIAPPWAALKPATVKDRMRNGYGGAHPILVRTGGLRASVTQRGAAGNVFQVEPHRITVGTTYPTAGFHQYGTSRMVARKMIGLKHTTRADVTRIIGDYVRQKAAEAGFVMRGNQWKPASE